jgi:hypothetical protein
MDELPRRIVTASGTVKLMPVRRWSVTVRSRTEPAKLSMLSAAISSKAMLRIGADGSDRATAPPPVLPSMLPSRRLT